MQRYDQPTQICKSGQYMESDQVTRGEVYKWSGGKKVAVD